MKFLDMVEVVSIEIYKMNNVKPLVSIGDIGEFVGYQDRNKDICMVKIGGGIRLLPKGHLEVL